MKLSISNIAWSEKHDQEMYSYISRAGFSGLEVAPTRLFGPNPYNNSQASSYCKDLLHTHNLFVSSLQSILYGKTEALFGSWQERTVLLEYVKKAIRFAQEIDCKNLVFGSPKNRIIRNASDTSLGISFFKELGDYAAGHNTILSIEPNPEIYGTNYITTTMQALNLVKIVNSPGFRVNADLGCCIQNEEDLSIIVNNIDLINHIHISEPGLALIRNRAMHDKLVLGLRSKNYQKFISIEMKDPGGIASVKLIIDYIAEVFGDN